MSTWYQATAKFKMNVKGKRKKESEKYVVQCVNHTDVEATLTKILSSRMANATFEPIKAASYNDVYIKDSVSGSESKFYEVTVELKDGKKTLKDVHLLNANSSKNANERVAARMKGTTLTWEITNTKRTKILGVYDHLQADLVQDFEGRQADLLDDGKIEADFNQYGIGFDKENQSITPPAGYDADGVELPKNTAESPVVMPEESEQKPAAIHRLRSSVFLTNGPVKPEEKGKTFIQDFSQILSDFTGNKN